MDARICLNCDISFIPNSPKQVCCTLKCNMDKWRKLNPDKYKQQQARSEAKRKGVNRYKADTRKAWYEKRKENPDFTEKLRRLGNARSEKIKAFLREYKLTYGCKDCGYKHHHAALDFDHIGTDKSINVCNAKSIKQAKNEIEKCEVVCSNCHRIRTYNRLQ